MVFAEERVSMWFSTGVEEVKKDSETWNRLVLNLQWMSKASATSPWPTMKRAKIILVGLRTSRPLARIYETESDTDGYRALSLYISKLNLKCEALFQLPRRDWKEEVVHNNW